VFTTKAVYPVPERHGARLLRMLELWPL
jgi:hypothetical protein